MKTLIVLPTYNESENLPQIVKEILSQTSGDVHLLIIDDNSPDGTGKMADGLSKENSRIFALHRPGKMGLGSAYREGFKYALHRDYEAVLQMDSDFSHSPGYLPAFFKEIESSDCVIGSRYIPGGGVKGWPFHRLWLSSNANRYARIVLGVDIQDLTGGFRCSRRKVLESIDMDSVFSDGYAFQIELNYRILCNRFTMKEIPIIFADRTRGKSKLSIGVIWEAIFIVWKLRFFLKKSS